jgi:hypothetical protein
VNGNSKLAQALQAIVARRYTKTPECQLPEAPADLPTTHAIQLAIIEGRLVRLEGQMTNQNRLLLIALIAVVGDILKHILAP